MMGGSRVLFVLLLLFAVGAGVTTAVQLGDEAQDTTAKQPANKLDSRLVPAGPNAGRFLVTIRKPPGPPRVVTTLKDVHGSSLTVACSTCHTTRLPDHQNKSVKTLDEFHSGMAFSHGTVSCLSCHNPGDYDSLQLADGSRVDFTDVMTLCGQCHGPQMKDYEHGVHGGLNGYWDLTRGPQQKNNCVDCHNPHAPQFPRMQPTFRPKDRFLENARSEH
jgi:formate-dependent nitrite reductase cytochrome c552 subunit